MLFQILNLYRYTTGDRFTSTGNDTKVGTVQPACIQFTLSA
jgi:hypothetical protein